MHIQQSGRSIKTMNAKNTKKSQIHENADANITCDFGDISRYRSRFPHIYIMFISSIIVRSLFLQTVPQEGTNIEGAQEKGTR